MKKSYSIIILAVSLLVTSSAWSQGSVTATYSTGDISTDRSFTSIPGTSSCPGLLDVVIPAGNIVASVDVSYDMTAGGGGYKIDQRSWLYCSTTSNGEATISSGSGSSAGTINYSRTGLGIADGASGTVSFEMHAGRSYGGSGCSTVYNKVVDGTWVITVNYIPAPSCLFPSALTASGETATTVDLAWTAGDSETLWDIELVDVTASGSATGTPTYNDITTNPYTLSGLTAQNNYQVYLRADCGAGDTSDWVGPVSFTTLCNATTTPYTEDFETFTTSAAAFTNENCWSSTGGSYFWEMAVGTDTSSSSTGPNPSITTGNYFFTEASGGSTGSTTSLTTFIDLSSLTVPLLSFDYHMYGSNMGSLDVIINSDTVLTLTGQQQTSDASPFITADVDLSSYAGQSVTVTFRGTRGAGWRGDIAIDNVSFVEAPSCLNPSSLAASGETATTVDLAWTAGGSETLWDIELVDVTPSGSATGTPTTEDISTNPYTLSGLTPGNEYQIYLRAVCGAAYTSDWVGPVSFTTLCATLSLPFSEGMDNTGSTPNCWTQSGAENWRFSTSGPGGYLDHIGSNGTINGNSSSDGYFAWVDASLSEANAILTSPLVDVSSLTTPMLSFYELSDNEGSDNSLLTVEVYDGAAWNTVGTYNSNTVGDAWEKKDIILDGLTFTGDAQVRFTFTEPVSSAYEDDIAIDDVSFVEAPSCINPTALAASGETATTVDLAWTAGGTETLWDIELVDVTASGSATGTPTTEDVTTNPYTLTGLTAQNDYQVYLRADCGAGNTSDWVGPVSFTTDCNATTTPYTEDFETFTTSAAAFTNENCWSSSGGSYFWEMAAGTDTSTLYTGPNPSITTGNYFFTDASAGSTGSTTSLTTFIDLSSLTVPLLSFDYHMYGSNMGSLDVIINSDTVLTLTGQQQTSDASPFITADVDLSSYAGQSVTVTFRGTRGAGWRGDIAIDNVSFVEAPSCLNPSSLAASGETATTVDLAWTAGGSETLWDIELVDVTASGSATGTPTTEDVTTNPYTLSGLTPENEYQIYLRAVCGAAYTSDWVGPVSFVTKCEVITTAFDEDFGAAGATFADLSCWEVVNGGDSNPWVLLGQASNADSNATGNYWNLSFSPAAHDDYLYSRPFTVTVGVTDTFSFKAWNLSQSWPEVIDVIVVDAFNNTLIATLETDLLLPTPPSTFEYDLTAYAGTDIRIGFYSSTTYKNVARIDDFSLYASTNWTGTTSSEWADVSNWSNGALPTSSVKVVIDGTFTNEPSISSTDAVAQSVTIASGNTLTIDETSSLTVSGDFTNSGTVTLNSTEDDFSSLIVTGTATGNIVYNRYVKFL